MNRPVLLDASFLIALEREAVSRTPGPAHRRLPALRGRKIVLSVVTVAEVLEGSTDRDGTLAALSTFTIQGLHTAHAQRCAALQTRSPRRLGENDAWLVATATLLDADLVGADREAFTRLGERYWSFR